LGQGVQLRLGISALRNELLGKSSCLREEGSVRSDSRGVLLWAKLPAKKGENALKATKQKLSITPCPPLQCTVCYVFVTPWFSSIERNNLK
jgi:hypothetical protein